MAGVGADVNTMAVYMPFTPPTSRMSGLAPGANASSSHRLSTDSII